MAWDIICAPVKSRLITALKRFEAIFKDTYETRVVYSTPDFHFAARTLWIPRPTVTTLLMAQFLIAIKSTPL